MIGQIRIVLLLVGALLGGYLVDSNLKTKFPIFSIGLPVAALIFVKRINADMNGSPE
ncbi:MAG: hypothetical protein H6598_04135 [Flavobacteriales bacterium]|nr:hypothetical protein [Flavobacteriales bacterium]